MLQALLLQERDVSVTERCKVVRVGNIEVLENRKRLGYVLVCALKFHLTIALKNFVSF